MQMAEYSINAKLTGILRDTHFLDKWKQHPDVLYARPLVEVRRAGHHGRSWRACVLTSRGR
jgi:hypothetical protein